MKKLVKKIAIAALVVFSVSLMATPAQAKTKKLSVNTVYTNAKKVKGKTKLKKAKVTAKIGKKTYKAKSSKKGNFTIKIKKKRKQGTKIKVTVYKGKKKYAKKTVKVKTVPWYMKKPFKGHKAALGSGSGMTYGKVPNQYDSQFLFYIKKGYHATFTYGKNIQTTWANEKDFISIYPGRFGQDKYDKNGDIIESLVGNNKISIKIYRNKDNKLVDAYTITPKKIKLPDKNKEIDYEQFVKDYNYVKTTGKEINKTIGNYYYTYRISKNTTYGVDYAIGQPSNYFESEANGSHVRITAKNGATLYITLGTKASFNFSEPSPSKYDVMVLSGQTKKWEGSDFETGELIDNNLCLKVYVYKNGKLVAMGTTIEYLIQGYSDDHRNSITIKN